MNTIELNQKYNGIREAENLSGVPCICRLAPNKNSVEVELKEKPLSEGGLIAYYRKMGSRNWQSVAVNNNPFCIDGLRTHKDFEIYVQAPHGEKSNVRLFRTGDVPKGAAVVNYLHPFDLQYEFSGRYLCSPYMLRLPGGRILASNDVFSSDEKPELTLIYYSDDNGKHWRYLSEIYPLNWGYFFIYQGLLYAFGCSGERNADLLIYRSEDEGKSWSKPIILIDNNELPSGFSGMVRGALEHKSHNGRQYFSIEFTKQGTSNFYPALISFKDGLNPMDKSSWRLSKIWDYDREKYKINGEYPDFEEGNLIITPDGKLQEILRTTSNHITRMDIPADDTFDMPKLLGVEDAPVSNSLFRIFKRKGYYYLVTNRESYKRYKYSVLKARNIWDMIDRLKHMIHRKHYGFNRNVLSVFRSKDTKSW